MCHLSLLLLLLFVKLEWLQALVPGIVQNLELYRFFARSTTYIKASDGGFLLGKLQRSHKFLLPSVTPATKTAHLLKGGGAVRHHWRHYRDVLLRGLRPRH